MNLEMQNYAIYHHKPIKMRVRNKTTSGIFWLLVASNWTPIIQLFVGIRSLLNTQDKLLDVGKTAIEQCLQTTAQQATIPVVSSDTAQKYQQHTCTKWLGTCESIFAFESNRPYIPANI